MNLLKKKLLHQNFHFLYNVLSYRKWKLIVGERFANPDISKFVKLKFYRWFHIFADYVVCNSYNNKELVHSACWLLPQLKVKVIRNIINFNIWKPLPNYFFKENSKLKLVILASHFYRKNLNGLLNALSLLKKDEIDKIRIEWYGDRLTEPYYDSSFVKAKQKIALLELEEVISFYPATNEIVQKVQSADAIGLFSFLEGFPNVVCEGMSCAKPVICSCVSDLPEILSLDKNLLCCPYDSSSIRRAISYLIHLNSDQLFQIGQKNEEIAKEIFNKENNLTEYIKLIQT